MKEHLGLKDGQAGAFKSPIANAVLLALCLIACFAAMHLADGHNLALRICLGLAAAMAVGVIGGFLSLRAN